MKGSIAEAASRLIDILAAMPTPETDHDWTRAE